MMLLHNLYIQHSDDIDFPVDLTLDSGLKRFNRTYRKHRVHRS